MQSQEQIPQKLKDTDTINFGSHKGKRLINVPAQYLLWLADQDWMKTGSGHYKQVFEYINDNKDALIKENKKIKR